MKPFQYILLGMGIVTAVLIGLIIGRRCHTNAPGGDIAPRVDTLVIRDTITITKAVYITKRVVDKEFVPVRDTLWRMDTLYVALDREQVIWEDSLSRVYASGIHPQVDSVTHFTDQVVITKEIPVIRKTRWGVGVQAGYGAGKDGLTPYFGIGVSYNLLAW